jgi:hypothetical protein
MWETYKQLERSLTKSGHCATAEVLSAEIVDNYSNRESRMGYAEVMVWWQVGLRVTPEDAPPFEVSQEMRVSDHITPRSGTTLEVLYDPADPKRMVVDPKTVPTTEQGSAQYALDSMAAAGFDTSGLGAAVEAGDINAIMNARHAAAAARANAQVAAAMQRRAAGQQAAGQQAASPQAAAPADVPSRLEKLFALKQAGVITDDDYETTKQRLLAEPI